MLKIINITNNSFVSVHLSLTIFGYKMIFFITLPKNYYFKFN